MDLQGLINLENSIYEAVMNRSMDAGDLLPDTMNFTRWILHDLVNAPLVSDSEIFGKVDFPNKLSATVNYFDDEESCRNFNGHRRQHELCLPYILRANSSLTVNAFYIATDLLLEGQGFKKRQGADRKLGEFSHGGTRSLNQISRLCFGLHASRPDVMSAFRSIAMDERNLEKACLAGLVQNIKHCRDFRQENTMRLREVGSNRPPAVT